MTISDLIHSNDEETRTLYIKKLAKALLTINDRIIDNFKEQEDGSYSFQYTWFNGETYSSYILFNSNARQIGFGNFSIMYNLASEFLRQKQLQQQKEWLDEVLS